MNILTLVRAAEELLPRTQPPEQATAPARPHLSWPLPATQLPGAHLTWAEWPARLAARLAHEQHSEHPVHL